MVGIELNALTSSHSQTALLQIVRRVSLFFVEILESIEPTSRIRVRGAGHSASVNFDSGPFGLSPCADLFRGVAFEMISGIQKCGRGQAT